MTPDYIYIVPINKIINHFNFIGMHFLFELRNRRKKILTILLILTSCKYIYKLYFFNFDVFFEVQILISLHEIVHKHL